MAFIEGRYRQYVQLGDSASSISAQKQKNNEYRALLFKGPPNRYRSQI